MKVPMLQGKVVESLKHITFKAVIVDVMKKIVTALKKNGLQVMYD